MKECFRWYGPDDPVPLGHVRQAGATGVVTALHDIYDGSAWPEQALLRRRSEIEAAGLHWAVVESIPVHNSIKLGTAERSRYIGWFKDTLRHLARAGISTICYNFMPVLDWTRTDLMFPLPTGGFALRFDAVDFAAYDLFVLKRPRVGDSYSGAQIETARRRFAGMTQETVDRLERNLIAGLPARERSFSREQLLLALGEYDGIGPDDLRANLAAFLREIIPVAEELGCRLCIHPDDPPFPLYGLPRIVSTSGDLQRIFDMYPANANGLTLCTGSLGAHPDNDLAEMARLFGPRIHFAHLRSVEREGDGSFVESEHLAGSSDLVAVIAALLNEQRRRQAEGRTDWCIPLRPDHGHLIADDIGKSRINPGYSLIGRLKGLAEIRGVMRGLAAAQLLHSEGSL